MLTTVATRLHCLKKRFWDPYGLYLVETVLPTSSIIEHCTVTSVASGGDRAVTTRGVSSRNSVNELKHEQLFAD